MDLVLEQNFKPILLECYKTDNDLINKWHIKAGNGLDFCVDDEYNELIKSNIEFCSLYKNSKLVGYFCKEDNGVLALSGFFIKPEYRNKECIQEFWNIVNSRFDNKIFFSVLYDNNEPAINFFKRNNGKEIGRGMRDKYPIILFSFGSN